MLPQPREWINVTDICIKDFFVVVIFEDVFVSQFAYTPFLFSKADGSGLLHFIQEYCTTPVDKLAFQAQLLMGRQLYSVMPAMRNHLKLKEHWPSWYYFQMSAAPGHPEAILWPNCKPTAVMEDQQPGLHPAVQGGQQPASPDQHLK